MTWKPGDVAMVILDQPHPRRGAGPFLMLRDVSGVKEVWRLACTGVVHEDHEVSVARPLVVIDPESRHSVEQLRDLYDRAYVSQTGHQLLAKERGDRGNALQAALREIAEPKPDEPAGLGAVVEDDAGRIYTRYETADEPQPWWQSAHGPEHDVVRRFSWADIDVVRILSEGVSA